MSSIKAVKGVTLKRVYRWGDLPYVYKSIGAITKAAPAQLTVTGHGIPDGWMVAVVGAQGMLEINAPNNPPKPEDYRSANVVDANTLRINTVNSVPYGTYVASSGTLVYLTPVSLVGFNAEFEVYDNFGNLVLRATDANEQISLNDTLKTISLNLRASETKDAAAFTGGKFRLNMISATGEITRIDSGSFDLVDDL